MTLEENVFGGALRFIEEAVNDYGGVGEKSFISETFTLGERYPSSRRPAGTQHMGRVLTTHVDTASTSPSCSQMVSV